MNNPFFFKKKKSYLNAISYGSYARPVENERIRLMTFSFWDIYEMHVKTSKIWQ